MTRLTRESQAAAACDGSRGRTWRVVSTEQANRFGRPTGYTLYPESAPVLLADPAVAAVRAGRVRDQPPVGHQVRPGRAVSGRRLRQPATRAEPALPAFIAGDQDIDGTDIVLWHTFGPTHSRGRRTGR